MLAIFDQKIIMTRSIEQYVYLFNIVSIRNSFSKTNEGVSSWK